MREILFRAKTVDDEPIWVEGYYTKTDAYGVTGYTPSVPIIADENGEWDEINPPTLGQFTGLTDKNGKKIFEGDIVKLPLSKRICKVVFKHGCFVAEYSSQGLNNFLYGGAVKIIGNIYDNPELLR